MKLCNINELNAKNTAPAPVAVPTGLFLMGLLLMTFDYPLTVLFGIFLAAWGATNLVMRITKLVCCLKVRKAQLARGQDTPPCIAS